MKLSVLLLLLMLFSGANTTTFDFGQDKAGTDWRPLNDGVMGGLSQGEVELTQNTLKFSGAVSLENYGGFTSIKSPFSSFDLSHAKMVTIRYRTTGQSIAISLENSESFFRPYCKVILKDTQGQWVNTEIELAAFKEYSLGQVSDRPISESFLSGVKRIGFITASKREGAFTLEVDYLNFE